MWVCVCLSLFVGCEYRSSWLAFLCLEVKGWFFRVGSSLPSSHWFWKTNLGHRSPACAGCGLLQWHHSDYCCDIFIHTHITSLYTHALVPINYFTLLLLMFPLKVVRNVKQPITYITYTEMFGMYLCVCIKLTWDMLDWTCEKYGLLNFAIDIFYFMCKVFCLLVYMWPKYMPGACFKSEEGMYLFPWNWSYTCLWVSRYVLDSNHGSLLK